MLLKGCFNSDPHNRTAWYSLTEKGEAVWRNSNLKDVIKANGSYTHVTSEVTPTSLPDDADVTCTYTHKDITHIDTHIEPKLQKRKTQTKKIWGEYNNVKLTDQEYERLVTDYGEQNTHSAIKFLDEYIEEKGYKSKSHNLALRRWVFDAVQQHRAKIGSKKASGDYDWGEIKRSLEEL
jgi:hypothetical protein